MPGIKPTGTNTEAKISAIAITGAEFPSWHVGSLFWRHVLLIDIMLHRLYHNNSIIHHYTDGQHKAKHGKRIDSKTQRDKKTKSRQNGYRDSQYRNNGRSPVLQEQKYHQCNQGQALLTSVPITSCMETLIMVIDSNGTHNQHPAGMIFLILPVLHKHCRQFAGRCFPAIERS